MRARRPARARGAPTGRPPGAPPRVMVAGGPEAGGRAEGARGPPPRAAAYDDRVEVTHAAGNGSSRRTAARAWARVELGVAVLAKGVASRRAERARRGRGNRRGGGGAERGAG